MGNLYWPAQSRGQQDSFEGKLGGIWGLLAILDTVFPDIKEHLNLWKVVGGLTPKDTNIACLTFMRSSTLGEKSSLRGLWEVGLQKHHEKQHLVGGFNPYEKYGWWFNHGLTMSGWWYTYPLKILGLLFPIYGEKKQNMFQTTNHTPAAPAPWA